MALAAVIAGERCELGPFDGALCTLCARLGTPAAIREDQQYETARQRQTPLRQLLRRFGAPNHYVDERARSRSPSRRTELSPTLAFPAGQHPRN